MQDNERHQTEQCSQTPLQDDGWCQQDSRPTFMCRTKNG